MRKVKNVRLKPGFAVFLKVIFSVFCILLGLFVFYRKQISDLKKIGYSEKASRNILFSKHKSFVISIGENKTLGFAFENDKYIEEYLDNYAKIKYVNHKHLIENINKLLKKGYSNSDINIILAHGTDKSVSEFAEKDRVRYLEEFFSFDYAKLENYDRYVSYSDETGESEIDTVISVNLNLDKEDYTETTLVEKFSPTMVVNKHRYLSESFVPDSLVTIDTEYASEKGLKSSRLALNAFIEMYKAAQAEGYDIVINSAYRSYDDQVEIENTYRDLYGQSYVDKYVAKPGFSEHQTGLAFDIGSKNSKIFADSKEYQWVLDNCYKYGFIYRFDKRYENLTGFRCEPWHFRYVGKDVAKYIYEHENMSLEEYFVLFLDK